MIDRHIFIGIDLSFNSTGITIFNQEENKLRFHRIAYREQKNKINQIHNVNLKLYSMPTNVITSEICDIRDEYSFEQYDQTLKGMVCIKQIMIVITRYLEKYQIHSHNTYVHINIEGFIQNTPNFNTLSGLVMLQGMLRLELVKHLSGLHFKFKMKITSPPTLKKFFTGNGEAEKLEMIYCFYKIYDGIKLINTFINNIEINDVVDSFALMYMSVVQHHNLLGFKKRVKKKRKVGGSKPKAGKIIVHRSIDDILNIINPNLTLKNK